MLQNDQETDNEITELDDFIPEVEDDFDFDEGELETYATEQGKSPLTAHLNPQLYKAISEEVDDFNDLDNLLRESVKLQGAKHAKSTGRKLTAEQEELLESARLAKEAQVWTWKSQYLAIRTTLCPDCNFPSSSVIGKYLYKVNSRGARILDKIEEFKPVLPKSIYYLPQLIETCPLCEIMKTQMPVQDVADCQAADLLNTL